MIYLELLRDYLSLLESDYTGRGDRDFSGGQIAKVKAALAEPAPEAVGWWFRHSNGNIVDHKSYPSREACLKDWPNPAWGVPVQLYTAPPPTSPGDARDAARYRWLAYVGDSTWVPLCRRDNGPGGQLFEQYIDDAYRRFRDSQKAAIERERGA